MDHGDEADGGGLQQSCGNGDERVSLLPQQVVVATARTTDNHKTELLPQPVYKNDLASQSSSTCPPFDAQRGSSCSLASSSHRKILEYIRSDSLDHRRHAVGRRRTSRPSAIAPTTDATDANRLPEHEVGQSRTKLLYDWPWLYLGSEMEYWRQGWATDGIAGLSVGLLVVPQSLSYAALAGLPVQYGLYAAFIPLVGYAAFGTSRQLAVGPVALLSLMLKSGLTELLQKQGFHPEDNDPEYQKIYNQLAIQCSLLLGMAYILMGLCRLGFVTIFLSHAVVSGFTTGAAILIALSQIKYLLGYNISGDNLPKLIESALANRVQWNPVTCALGSAATAAVLSFKKVRDPRYQWLRPAGPMLVTAVALLLSVGFQQWNPSTKTKTTTPLIPCVGPIPKGLPGFTLNLLWTPVVSDGKGIMWVVLPMIVVGFMESIAIGAYQWHDTLEASLDLK